MSTNLRLRPEVADAVKAEAARTGRSQQDILRNAVEQHLFRGGVPDASTRPDPGILPPRTPWRRAEKLIRLPRGTSSADLLDADMMVVYDARLAAAAEEIGLRVIAPA